MKRLVITALCAAGSLSVRLDSRGDMGAQQLTYIGAPHIRYGDEVGVWGAADACDLLAYERVLSDERAVVAFNTSNQPQTLAVDVENGTHEAVYPGGATVDVTNGSLTVQLRPGAAAVWIRV